MSNVSSSNGLGKYPKLRFKGFFEPWNATVLSDTFKKNSKKNTNGSITNVICNSAKNGLIPQREYFDKDIANADNTDGYYIIEKDDFVYNPRKSTEAPYGPVSIYKYAEQGIVSPLYLCFRALHPINAEFFDFYFKSTAWHRYIYLSGDSGARHDRVSIRDDIFFAMPINLPSNEEQYKISSLLTLIEKKIKAQAALVENLKKYKRGLLSTIFSKVTTFVHLKDICEYASSAKTMSQIDNTPKGAYPVYDAGGVAAFVDFYDMDTNYIAIIKDGSGVGRLQFCQAKSSFIGTLGGLIPKNCSAFYLYTALQTIDFKEYVTGMAIPHIYYKDYKEAMLPYPCEEERAKIEIVFQYLDDKIAKAELLLTKLNELKKSFLQQLFI